MKENKVLTGKINLVFFSYAIPVALGLLAVSSAAIIDGLFIGNYVGEKALAAVAIATPVFPFLFGVAIMFATGGEVFCGKYLGEGRSRLASDVFTKIVLLIQALTILISVVGILFLEPLATLLGAQADTMELVTSYLRVIFLCSPLIASYSLSYFIRVDGRPQLSAGALVITAVLNVILDYLFIVVFNWRIEGAAWGTMLSYCAMPVLLLPHFIQQKGQIGFVKPIESWKIIGKIAYNGSSEFLSEISGGILFTIINVTMIRFYGTSGVAAYAIVGYLLLFVTTTNYGVSDSLKSIISINHGAGQKQRVGQFLRLAIGTVSVFGAIIILITQLEASTLVSLFLNNERANTETIKLANQFLVSISPIFLILGTNIILSAYFTAIHQPGPSLIISLLRTLILPIILIPTLTEFWSGIGIFIALISSEAITLTVAIFIAGSKREKRPQPESFF
ncbi:MATE family efflux transporter [Prolixibacteraceae bacterium JC049]|nr:MATE family efflux transporter [Prolixibacteraceae bacterium JC049]